MRRRLRRHHGVPSSRSATRGVGARKGDNWRLSFSTLLPPRRAALYRAMGGVPILLGVALVNGVRAAATQPILRWHEMRKAAGGGVRGGHRSMPAIVLAATSSSGADVVWAPVSTSSFRYPVRSIGGGTRHAWAQRRMRVRCEHKQ